MRPNPELEIAARTAEDIALRDWWEAGDRWPDELAAALRQIDPETVRRGRAELAARRGR